MYNKKSKSDENKQERTRVILNIPEELDEAYTKLARKRGITKSSMISYAMSWYLDYNKIIDLMPKLIELLKDAPEDLK